jgi:hypothetical protein
MNKFNGIIEKKNDQYNSLMIDGEWYKPNITWDNQSGEAVPDVDFSPFTTGQHVECNYKENKSPDGRVFKNITFIKEFDGKAPTNSGATPSKVSNITRETTSDSTDRVSQQRKDIYVTGIVGRSMGSGHFSVDEIDQLTENAVKAFNKHVK